MHEHRFFPVRKFATLDKLMNGVVSEVEMVVEMSKSISLGKEPNRVTLSGSSPTNALQTLARYQRYKIVKSVGKGANKAWKITNEGRRIYKYLVERLKSEYGGTQGLADYIIKVHNIKAAEAAEKKESFAESMRRQYMESVKEKEAC